MANTVPLLQDVEDKERMAVSEDMFIRSKANNNVRVLQNVVDKAQMAISEDAFIRSKSRKESKTPAPPNEVHSARGRFGHVFLRILAVVVVYALILLLYRQVEIRSVHKQAKVEVPDEHDIVECFG